MRSKYTSPAEKASLEDLNQSLDLVVRQKVRRRRLFEKKTSINGIMGIFLNVIL